MTSFSKKNILFLFFLKENRYFNIKNILFFIVLYQ